MSAHECEPLFSACGPDIYRRNAFRLLGMHVDRAGRQLKRKEKELQSAIEVDELADEYKMALRPDPLPTREELSHAGRILADAQQRFIQEFFWFWPLEWGKSVSDEVLQLLETGKILEAQKRWKQIESLGGDCSLVAMHNLAVLGHLSVLDREQKVLESSKNGNLTLEIRKDLNAYWTFAFKHWEPLCTSEAFWSIQADRIRALDDPRLTTGFLRRFSQSLPVALDNINADLAVRYCEKAMYIRAKDHVQIMRATNSGIDDVDTSLRRVTSPLHKRIDYAIESATFQLAQGKVEGKQRCIELFNTVCSILNVLAALLGQESQEFTETCDRVVDGMLQCQGAYGRETKDWKTIIVLLETTLKVAQETKTRDLIKEQLEVVRSFLQEDYCWFCASRPKEDKHSIKVTLNRPIRWREMKGNPEEYRDDILQFAAHFVSLFQNRSRATMDVRVSRPISILSAGVRRGDLRAVVRALDSALNNDSLEILTQQLTTNVPRCQVCTDVHSRWSDETIGAIQAKVNTVKSVIESECEILRCLESDIASHLRDIEGAAFLRRWWLAWTLRFLRTKQNGCTRRLEEAKKEQVRLQSLLVQRERQGACKPYNHFQAWPAVAEAKSNGFHVS